MLVKPENGTNEAIDLLNRALSHGSARAAKMLAEIYRNGELDQAKDPLLAMKYAFLAIKLSVQADPAKEDGNPFYEIDAGILLAEMAVNGQAVDVNDRGLLNPDEIDRLQRFYGTVDPETHKVKIRRLDVPLGGCSYPSRNRSGCGIGGARNRRPSHSSAVWSARPIVTTMTFCVGRCPPRSTRRARRRCLSPT